MRGEQTGVRETDMWCHAPLYRVSETVRLSEAAYERLAARKRDGETFSEVVVRLTDDRSLQELGGVLGDEEADAVRDAVAERRERRVADLESIADQFE